MPTLDIVEKIVDTSIDSTVMYIDDKARLRRLIKILTRLFDIVKVRKIADGYYIIELENTYMKTRVGIELHRDITIVYIEKKLKIEHTEDIVV